MRRKLIVLVVAGCLLALAGCTGGLTDDGQTVDDVTYPDGVSENGTNLSALAAGHSDALNGSSFTLTLDMTQNQSENTQSVGIDAAVSADRDEIRVNTSTQSQRVSTYLTEDRQYTRLASENASGGETIYDASDRTDEGVQMIPASYSGATYVEQFGARADANFTPTDVREVDGTTLVVLRADGSNVSAPEEAAIRGYNATILVDEQGVIHSFEVTVETEQNDTTTNVTLSMEVSNVNETSVEEPSWLDEARNQTDN